EAAEIGADCTIISSDKDLMQLVGPQVIMYDQMKDRRIGTGEVMEKFGVGPDMMIDLQALAGDSSDNIPGVPGIGPKTAALLLNEFGDLETLLSRAGEIKQNKRRENLIEFADQARLSRRLVELVQDVPLEVPLDALSLEPVNGPRLIAYLKAMELTTLTRRVAKEAEADIDQIEADVVEIDGYAARRGPDLDADGSAKPAPQDQQPGDAHYTPQDLTGQRMAAARGAEISREAYECIRTIEELDRWIEAATHAGTVAFDTETNSLDAMQAELVGISLALAGEDGKIRACYIPISHKSGQGDLLGGGLLENQISEKEVLSRLKPMLEDPSVLKIAQNMKYDWLLLFRRGVEITPFDDTMLLSYVLDAGRNRHNMDTLCDLWLGHEAIHFKDIAGSGKSMITFDLVELDKAVEYAAEDADVTLRLWQVLKPRLVAEGMATVYERLERPLVEVICRMEARGISVDRQILSRLSGELAQGAARLEAGIYQLAGEKFNIGSPKQLGEILFGKLGLPGGRKTKSGQYSTAAGVLEDLAAEGHDLPSNVVQWRQLTKLKSTYTDALPHFINPDTSRVHTSYAMASTSTGRLSSSDPNLQNIPVRTEEGRKIRTAFVAEAGNKLLSADYSQIELRVLAHVADIAQLKQAFADGIDIHAMTASEMFNTPVEGMDPMVRRQAKAINFGIIYGISAFGLAAQLGISRGEASDYIKMY
ncbi:MAG: DNA polymerase I, partial [Rhodobacteraceae bacterium]|nr:DNA polymerase I [Paracoccaceae bacterium]